MSYTAQELNRKVTFQKLTIEQDPITGAMVEAWVDYASAFAKVEPLLGREFWAAAATQSEDSVKFTIRYRGDLDTAMRIAFDGEDFNITSIQNIRSANRETLIYGKAL
ncbi:phage head closure protein [Stenotrophomonas sp.]|uniref:phage head closure protein n=1 Tax=Stenotrophomonas sp. TaxID=69392 RepID=UPI0025DAAF35|nr:phage head closure protein [Stenotrophomonas sp.]MBW8373630.1 phage head closure protein [Stenotrophomonas sp.]